MAGKYALLWSGGKDGALALQRARSRGLNVAQVHTFYEAATDRVRFHATRIEVVRSQVEAIEGVEFSSSGTTWEAMEDELLRWLSRLRSEEYGGVVLGDIHLVDVRAWYEDRVRAAGLEHVEPLWGDDSADLLREFVSGSGRAVITCVDTTRLDKSWLGRVIDEQFVEDIAAEGIDACGENGEYHSFAFAGPMFARPIAWRPGETHTDSRFVQLDVLSNL